MGLKPLLEAPKVHWLRVLQPVGPLLQALQAQAFADTQLSGRIGQRRALDFEVL